MCSRVRAAGRIDVALWSAGPDNELVSEWADRLGTSARLQPDGDLGVKLSAAFDEGLRRYERVVIIGSDAPPSRSSSSALPLTPSKALGSCSAPRMTEATTPSALRIHVGPSFDGVRWSTAHAFADTVKANAQRAVATIAPWYDIDEPEDLAVLRAHLSVDPAAAPATATRLGELGRDQR